MGLVNVQTTVLIVSNKISVIVAIMQSAETTTAVSGENNAPQKLQFMRPPPRPPPGTALLGHSFISIIILVPQSLFCVRL